MEEGGFAFDLLVFLLLTSACRAAVAGIKASFTNVNRRVAALQESSGLQRQTRTAETSSLIV